MGDEVELLKKIIETAKEKKCLLNPAILELVLFKTKGKCPCKINTECPCESVDKDLDRIDMCHCGLFVRWKNEKSAPNI